MLFRLLKDKFRRLRTGLDIQKHEIREIVKREFVVRLVSSMTSLCSYGNCLVTLMRVTTMTQITYNTPSWAVSDLQSPPSRTLCALGIGDCKSDTALLGVL